MFFGASFKIKAGACIDVRNAQQLSSFCTLNTTSLADVSLQLKYSFESIKRHPDPERCHSYYISAVFLF